MEQFTPLSSTIGGVLIGLSASALLLCAGEIAGISGICGNLLSRRPGEGWWRASFLAGMVLAGLVVAAFWPAAFVSTTGNGLLVLFVASVLVGFGTRLGNGCTSGHGVCGLSRLSARSLVATLTFMLTGAGTVFVVRHLIGGA